MPFKGEVLSVQALLASAAADQAPERPSGPFVVRHTAAGNARRAADLIAAGDGLEAGWRFGILQTIDDYGSTLRRGGSVLGAVVFQEEKLHAARDERDLQDAAVLYNVARLTERDDARQLLAPSYPASQLLPRHHDVVDDVAQRAAALRDGVVPEVAGSGAQRRHGASYPLPPGQATSDRNLMEGGESRSASRGHDIGGAGRGE